MAFPMGSKVRRRSSLPASRSNPMRSLVMPLSNLMLSSRAKQHTIRKAMAIMRRAKAPIRFPYQQPLVHTKDHVAAGLLCDFLLGVFGVHKFYLGYHTTGFIMLGVTILGSLLTIGIAAGVVWLIGVIEGIIYLTKSQSEFEQLYVFNKREMF